MMYSMSLMIIIRIVCLRLGLWNLLPKLTRIDNTYISPLQSNTITSVTQTPKKTTSKPKNEFYN